MSERSEFRAAPIREEHRGPMRFHRIGSRPAVFLLVTFSLHEQREVTRSRREAKALLLLLSLLGFSALGTSPPAWRRSFSAVESGNSQGMKQSFHSCCAGASTPFFARAKKGGPKKTRPHAIRRAAPAGPLRSSRAAGTAHNSLRSDTCASFPSAHSGARLALRQED